MKENQVIKQTSCWFIMPINFNKLFVFVSRYFVGSHIFPDVLLNDIAGPEGDPLLLSLKLSVDVLVSNPKLGSPDL